MFSPCRVCTKDTEIGGYKIPKGVGIMLNSPGVSRDPDIFPEPNVIFCPDFFSISALPRQRGLLARSSIGSMLGFLIKKSL